MSPRSAVHSTFTIERVYAAAPARVFAAWSTPEKARWFGGPDNWQKSDYRIDFRIGGSESVSGGPEGGPVHYYDARFQDIVPNERIVSTYDMHMDKTRISVSLATVELRPEGKGTRLILTEQGVFLDGHDDAGSRERGTRDLLDNLEAYLVRQNLNA
ncbi:MAG TPA: SRPBCC family protein [Parvibaculum sp.]|jgi:uncharacterized protein YndB with AHSA1/START domain